MPPSILSDVMATRPVGSGVVMLFREFPPGVVLDVDSGPAARQPDGWDSWGDLGDAATVAPGEVGGWVPKVGAEAGPDRGFTPFDWAVSELLRAARDSAAGAWIMTLVRLAPPAAIVALADLFHEQRRNGGRGRGF
jgi:hypothetical protein